jgi:phage terminase large subunit-like protein
VKAYDGRDSIAYELYQYGKKIQNGEVSDPNFFMAWWEAPAESDHTDPEVWRQANPGFDDLVSAEDFASAVKRTPEAEFRTKRLNQWVNSQTAWLPGGAWDACKRDIEWDGDAEYILGFDGSFSGDSTALVACTIPKEDEQPRIFLVAAWEKDYGVDDDSWRVPIAEVEQTIRDFIQANPYCREIACDPFRWQRSMEALMNEGLPIVEYNTGSLARMIPATAKFYDAVAEQRIEHDGNPVIARHLDNCVLKVDARGPRVTKAKDGSKRKIDAAISTLIAFDRATVGRIELGAPEFFI